MISVLDTTATFRNRYILSAENILLINILSANIYIYIYIYGKKGEHYNSIIMEYQNIIDLLINTQNQPFKFKIKK